MGILDELEGLAGGAAGATVAVKLLEEVDPNAGMLEKTIAGFVGTQVASQVEEHLGGAGNSEQPST